MNHDFVVSSRENPFSLDKELIVSCKRCGATLKRLVTIRDIVNSPIQMDKYVDSVGLELQDILNRASCI